MHSSEYREAGKLAQPWALGPGPWALGPGPTALGPGPKVPPVFQAIAFVLWQAAEALQQQTTTSMPLLFWQAADALLSEATTIVPLLFGKRRSPPSVHHGPRAQGPGTRAPGD